MIHHVIYQFQQNYCRYTSDIVWTEKIFLRAFVQIHFFQTESKKMLS